MVDKVTKSDADWRAQLTAEQFKVARKKGTERAFSGQYWDHHAAGVYRCVCCGTPLFGAVTPNHPRSCCHVSPSFTLASKRRTASWSSSTTPGTQSKNDDGAGQFT